MRGVESVTDCPGVVYACRPLAKCWLARYSFIRSEQFFVNGLAVLILDPSRVSLAPLVLDVSKCPVRVIGFGFDYPSRHGITRQEQAI